MLLFENLIEQLAALHQLHDEAPVSLVLEHVKELDNVRVIDLLQDLNLILHGSFILVTHLLLRQNLDCKPLTRSPELRLLDGGKTASTDRSLDLVGLFNVTIVWVFLITTRMAVHTLIYDYDSLNY